ALQLPFVEGSRERQHLQGHTPAQRQLLGLIDDAHAATADLAQNAEVAQGRGTREVQGRGRAVPSFSKAALQAWSGCIDEVQRVETGAQLGTEGGVACQESVAVRLLAGLPGSPVFLERLQDP